MASSRGLDVRGIVPPVITAFDQKGNFDPKGQREIIAFLKQRVQGFFVCGSYGSGPLMSVEERKQCAEVVMDEAGGQVAVIIHIGTMSTRDCLELARHAEEIGATGVGAVPPYYFGHSEANVKEHFRRLIDSVDIPVYIYNNPKTTGFSVSPKFLNELAQIGLAGVKDSSFNILTFYAYVRMVEKPDFQFIIGTEGFILPTVPMGARASIAGLGNAIPEPVVELFEASAKGDMKEAVPLQKYVLNLRDVMHLAPSSVSVQAILRQRGVNSGYPRMPFQKVDEAVLKEMLRRLRELDVRL